MPPQSAGQYARFVTFFSTSAQILSPHTTAPVGQSCGQLLASPISHLPSPHWMLPGVGANVGDGTGGGIPPGGGATPIPSPLVRFMMQKFITLTSEFFSEYSLHFSFVDTSQQFSVDPCAFSTHAPICWLKQHTSLLPRLWHLFQKLTRLFARNVNRPAFSVPTATEAKLVGRNVSG